MSTDLRRSARSGPWKRAAGRLPFTLALGLALVVSAILLIAPFLPALSPEGADAKALADIAHLIAFSLGWRLSKA